MRVADDGALEAAKPVKEGLSDQAWQGMVQRCRASPVCPFMRSLGKGCQALLAGCLVPKVMHDNALAYCL